LVQLVEHLRPQRKRVEPVRDRAAEGRLLRVLGIDMELHVVVCRGREAVDQLLRDLVPITDAELLADAPAQTVDAADREHWISVRAASLIRPDRASVLWSR